MTRQFRTLPVFGADQRQVSEIVRGMMDGKTNNTGLLTLATGNAVQTTLFDGRIGNETLIYFVAASDAAEADYSPYGEFQDDTDQTAANTTTGYAITLNTTDYSNGIYVSDSSRLNVRNYGIYNIQFSLQYKNTTNDGQDVDVWFMKNGTNVVGSNRRFHLNARKSSGDPSHLTAAMSFFLEMNANDYAQIMWRTTDVGVSLEHYATSTSPTRPAIPSALVTVSYVAPLAISNVYVSSQQIGQATVKHWANSTANKTYGYILVG